MLLATGCASKSDLAALSTRVDAVEASQKSFDTELESIKSDHEAIKSDISDLNAKVDRAFAKGKK